MERPKLLLADDSVTIRKVVELTFADEGIDVTAVPDADAAMQRFVETEPDIVLVDATLAGTSGYRICEMIKADDATRHIPVLLLVGSFERFDDDEAVRVGADGFMTKPFQSIRELVAKVRDLLSASNGAAPPTMAAEDSPVPVFGEGFFESPASAENTDTELPPEVGEEDDIDHLYRESFTAEGPEAASESLDEEFLGYVGMDDDMIEASYSAPTDTVDEEDLISVPLRSEYDSETKFDWSPDAVISEADESADESRRTDQSRWSWSEPMPLREVENTFPDLEASDSEMSGMETLEMNPQTFEGTEPAELAASDDDSEILDLDLILRPSAVATEPARLTLDAAPMPEPEPDQGDEPDPSIHETIPYAAGEQPPIREPEETIELDEFPQELVEKIAQRVIEKLSDSVVREIARIEVPRVAEKLIREALDGNKNN